MGMRSFLRVMEYEIYRGEKETNNNNEWIGQVKSTGEPYTKA